MRKMIQGKYDSQFKWQRRKLVRGCFDTAMNYTRRHKGGMQLIAHIRHQPWETWRQL